MTRQFGGKARREPADSARVLRRRRTQHREHLRGEGTIVIVIALGGGLGALARYGLALLWPTPAAGFPWATFTTNVTGCFCIGVLMATVIDVWPTHALIRPFTGTGVLGGFTTFSAYASDSRVLLQPGTAALALAYLAATVVCALVATVAGLRLTRAVAAAVRGRKAVA